MNCDWCGFEKETTAKEIGGEKIEICQDCIDWRERLIKDGLYNDIDILKENG